MQGAGGFSTSVRLLVSVRTSIDGHYDSSFTFIVVHYVSSLYFHCYDYYSFSNCGVFGMSSLSLVTLAPSSMGFPTTLGQHDMVLLHP